MSRLAVVALLLAAVAAFMLSASAQERVGTKQVIAHRGASAYAPEHTAAAYRLALNQGADYVEQDLAVTRDGVLICLHDESLERTTDVEDVFPDRATASTATGRKTWLAADFTLAEIKRLDAGSWFDPAFSGERILTFEEAVTLVGDRAGLYPELKTPALYRARGVDQTALLLDAVRRLRLDARPRGSVVVQSFDPEPLRDITGAMPGLSRTFLIDTRDAAKWFTPEGMKEIARFANDVGLSKRILDGHPERVALVHQAGLTVTPYTVSTRTTSRFADISAEMRYYLFDLGVDAVFTDNPDRFPRRK